MPAKASIESPSNVRLDPKAIAGAATQPGARTVSEPRTLSKPGPVSVTASSRPRSNSSEEVPAAKSQAPTAVQPVEPEDAYLTGVSRSLQRRLLGLNVQGAQGQSKPHHEVGPGLHATGSFTSAISVPAKGTEPKTS